MKDLSLVIIANFSLKYDCISVVISALTINKDGFNPNRREELEIAMVAHLPKNHHKWEPSKRLFKTAVQLFKQINQQLGPKNGSQS